MKVTTFKHSMRFIKDGQWWRIKFPVKKDGVVQEEGRIEHRCFIKNDFLNFREPRWIECRRSNLTKKVTCDACDAQVPEEVLADSKMLGIDPASRSFYDDYLKKNMNDELNKLYEQVWPQKPVEVPKVYTSDGTSNDLTLYNDSCTNPQGVIVQKNPNNPSVTRYTYPTIKVKKYYGTVKITNAT